MTQSQNKNEKDFEEKIENWGEKVGEKIEEKWSEKNPGFKQKTERVEDVIGNIIAIIISIGMLYFFNQEHYRTLIPFITEDFILCLPVFNLSIAVNITVYSIFLFYEKKPIKQIGQIVMNIFAIISIYRFFTIFPFDFNLIQASILNTIVRASLLLGILGTVIGTIAEIHKALR